MPRIRGMPFLPLKPSKVRTHSLVKFIECLLLYKELFGQGAVETAENRISDAFGELTFQRGKTIIKEEISYFSAVISAVQD